MSLLEIGVRPSHHMLLPSVRNAPDCSLILLPGTSPGLFSGAPALLLVCFTLKANRDISSWDRLFLTLNEIKC